MNEPCVIFGGTFDPVHNGHVQTAHELADRIGYSQVMLMPCGDAYHKASDQASAQDRLKMLTLATADYSELVVDKRELDRAGPTFTVDTLAQLRAELGPDTHISWVMGQDAAQGLTGWHQWQEIFQLANLIVVARPEEVWPDMSDWPADVQTDPEAFKKQAHGAVFCMSLTPLAISSSMVRKKVKDQQSIDDLVPVPVVNWIQANGLYR